MEKRTGSGIQMTLLGLASIVFFTLTGCQNNNGDKDYKRSPSLLPEEATSGYRRIISLAPSLTKNLFYLDAGDKLAGCTSFCEVQDGLSLPVVASAIKVDLEKIVSLKPDLIVLTPLTNPETIAFLKKLNIRIEVFPTPKNFDEICTQFLFLGELVGRRDTAQRVIDQAKLRVSCIAEKHQAAEGKKIFFQIGANPVFTVLPNTFMDDFITLLGGSNIAAGMKGGVIGRESVVIKDPEIIFVATMGMTGEAEMRIWESYGVMSAAKNRQIYLIDSDLACLPTPVTFAETLEIMAGHLEEKNNSL